jgi:hypothetical protein
METNALHAQGSAYAKDRADILGIEIGDTHEEAKSKLLALWNEGSQDKATPPRGGAVKEDKSVFRLDAPGSQTVTTASFIKRLEMQRQSKECRARPRGQRQDSGLPEFAR